MNYSFIEVFKIDKLGKGIFSKILFAILVLIGCSVYFTPIGDPDFSGIYTWAYDVAQDYTLLLNPTTSLPPITTGNILYAIHMLAADFLIIMGATLYMAVCIRDYRMRHGIKDAGDSGYLIPVRYLSFPSLGNLTLRMIVIFCFSLVLTIPGIVFLLYLFLIFIIILPCAVMFPACYLSGDTGFGRSFRETVKITRGYYMINVRNMTLIMMVYFILRGLAQFIAGLLPSSSYVLLPVINVFTALSLGRYVAMVYLRMREMPGGPLNAIRTPHTRS